jgi:hypothetical protein
MKIIFTLLLLLSAAAFAAPPAKIGDDWTQASLPDQPKPRLPDLAQDPARDWKQHTFARDAGEDYNCALSFGIGGELKSGGYVGARALGHTLNLKPPAKK